MSERKRPGRRPKDQKRLPLSMRVTPALRDFLVSTATANGRSITQEAEVLLEHGRRDEGRLEDILDLAYGPWLAGVLMALGEAMQEAGRGGYFGQATGKVNVALAGPTALIDELQNWRNDPNAFNQSVKAALTILNAIRPEGEYQPATEADLPRPGSDETVVLEDFALQPSAIGHAAGLRVLNAVAQPGKIGPTVKRRWSLIREKLGDEVVARINSRARPAKGSEL